MDLTDKIIAFESDELSDEETVELFSMLIKNGKLVAIDFGTASKLWC